MASPFIYLASGSPRRRELLDQIGVRYRVLSVAVDESVVDGEAPADYTLRLAEAKARAGLRYLAAAGADGEVPAGDPVVLSADTAVVIAGRILGKPKDRDDGIAMLALLAGRTHQVLTAVALAAPNQVETRLSVSEVTFRAIGAPEAQAYWDSGEPLDKAGGYGIQGRGAIFVAHLQGSYSGVMGLPLFETAQLLARRVALEVPP